MITNLTNIPDELKTVPQWVCVCRDNKIPRNPFNGMNAKANDPKTWGTFDQAVSACQRFGFEYIGFEFAPPYFGVDLDHCIDDVDFCDEFVETLQSYTEISRSGDGIHIICKGTLPDGARRKGGVEMYSEGRYFICTGNIYKDEYKTVKECTDSVKFLHNKYLYTPTAASSAPVATDDAPVTMDDIDILDKAVNSKSGQAFALLYGGDWSMFPSHSEADMALCNHLAFWTGKNAEQMDRLFRKSGLMRDKWDQQRGGDTYGNITIAKACAGCTNTYSPRVHGDGENVAIAMFGKNGPKVAAKAKTYEHTDTGNAERFYDKHGKNLKYSFNRKKWYYWDGSVWVIDERGVVKKMADEVCADIKNEALQITDEKKQEAALKWARRSSSSNAKEAMVKECQHLYDVPAAPDDFDSNVDLLNCKNGIVNLKTGELMPHDRELMMSKIINCDYDVDHKKPEKWLQFLDDVTAGDKDIQEYIQRCVGYSLTGSGREQCTYFLYGMGNNGKSTFLDTIADIMGEYARNMGVETIMQNKFGSGNGANTQIARLRSARFVTCEEPPEGVINESIIKQITGGSKVTARFLFGDEFEFTPEFKLWIATNHKPIIKGTDLGIWRRIKLIPFEVNIPKEKVDKNLKFKLREEFPQILAWAVEGAMKWYESGDLKEPAKVTDSVKEYRQEMDLIATFVEQCVEIDYEHGETVSSAQLFSIYRAWAKEHNEWEMSSNRFGREMAKKTPEKAKTAKGVVYRKIRLTDYALSLVPRQYKIEDFKG